MKLSARTSLHFAAGVFVTLAALSIHLRFVENRAEAAGGSSFLKVGKTYKSDTATFVVKEVGDGGWCKVDLTRVFGGVQQKNPGVWLNTNRLDVISE